MHTPHPTLLLAMLLECSSLRCQRSRVSDQARDNCMDTFWASQDQLLQAMVRRAFYIKPHCAWGQLSTARFVDIASGRDSQNSFLEDDQDNKHDDSCF
jgi:hypothetical protein